MKRTVQWLAAFLINLAALAVIVKGCSGGTPPVEMTVTVPLPPPVDVMPPPVCDVIIRWTPPSARVDDEPFTQEEIKHYTVLVTGANVREELIEDGFLISWSMDGFSGGETFFAMTVTDTDDRTSDPSNTVSIDFDGRCS
jgi:hypothetical protein